MSPPPPYPIQEQQGPHQTQPEKPELQQQKQQHKLNNSLIIKNKPKLAKCMSIVHLFGNAYSTQQYASCHKDNDMTTNGMGRLPTIGRELNNKSKLERFKHRSENQIDGKSDAANLYNDTDDASSTTPATITITTTTKPLPIEDFCDDKDLGARAFRTISKRLGMIWRRSNSVEISTPDPEYKVFYLGNVLTGWAKGENCVEKPLATLWRNYAQINKPDVTMRVLVCPSGLKATTRQHGLTEYWSNRITYCCSPKNYPRVFCWVYRHEGRKLKHELRCHAVLCTKDTVAEQICKTLKENLSQALKEFKRDKISKQNARLSLVNSLYENPSMPRRKILLSVGANNYRPPMERSKSAPKLMSIEEAVGEEEDIGSMGQTKRHQTQSVRGSNAWGLSIHRRHFRRNRSAALLPDSENSHISHSPNQWNRSISADATPTMYQDEYDEFNSLFANESYDAGTSLSNEILSYFDIKLKLDKNNEQPLENEDCDFVKHPNVGIDNSMLSSLMPFEYDAYDIDGNCSLRDSDGSYIGAAMSKMLDLDAANNNSESEIERNASDANRSAADGLAERSVILDSDEGSITSGCETLSVVTTTHCDDLLKNEQDDGKSSTMTLTNGDSDDNIDKNSQRAISNTHTECITSIPRSAAIGLLSTSRNEEDSEFSDESGFDENNMCRPNGFSSDNIGSSSTVSSTMDKRGTDANNNIRNGFDSNIKTMRRMKINIPKNARSIHI